MYDRNDGQAGYVPSADPGIAPESVVYFADPMLTFGCASIEQEYKENVALKLELHRIKFANVRCTTDPPFAGTHRSREMGHYDILFFDWGGMGVVDQKMMSSFCRLILREATDHPSRFYVVTSAFTELAMKDAMASFGDAVPANMFLSLTDFIRYYKAYANLHNKPRKPDNGQDEPGRKLRLIKGICSKKEGVEHG